MSHYEPDKQEPAPQRPDDEARERQEPGEPETKVGAFMRVMGHLRGVYGPANRRVAEEELRHQPSNPEDLKEQTEIEGIDVETDSEGHHYGVRKHRNAG